MTVTTDLARLPEPGNADAVRDGLQWFCGIQQLTPDMLALLVALGLVCAFTMHPVIIGLTVVCFIINALLAVLSVATYLDLKSIESQ